MAEVLEFNRDLYPLEAVQAAVTAYGELASFEVEATVDAVRVQLSDPADDVPHLADEFANHVLYAAVGLSRKGGQG